MTIMLVNRGYAVDSRLSVDAAATTVPTTCPIPLGGPQHCDLVIYRGDSGHFRVSVKLIDDTPVDVSSATWDCDIRSKIDAEVVTSLVVTPVAGQTNTVDVALTPAQSELLNFLPETNGVWDLEMTLAGEVITLFAGEVIVTKDVSQ